MPPAAAESSDNRATRDQRLTPGAADRSLSSRELARGWRVGEVYLVRDFLLERDVAIKVRLLRNRNCQLCIPEERAIVGSGTEDVGPGPLERCPRLVAAFGWNRWRHP